MIFCKIIKNSILSKLNFNVAKFDLKTSKKYLSPSSNRSFTFPTQKSVKLNQEFKARSEDKIRRLECGQKEETNIKNSYPKINIWEKNTKNLECKFYGFYNKLRLLLLLRPLIFFLTCMYTVCLFRKYVKRATTVEPKSSQNSLTFKTSFFLLFLVGRKLLNLSAFLLRMKVFFLFLFFCLFYENRWKIGEKIFKIHWKLQFSTKKKHYTWNESKKFSCIEFPFLVLSWQQFLSCAKLLIIAESRALQAHKENSKNISLACASRNSYFSQLADFFLFARERRTIFRQKKTHTCFHLLIDGSREKRGKLV